MSLIENMILVFMIVKMTIKEHYLQKKEILN